jgi:nucleotide-binding universal stress UspA family protein
MAKQYGAAIHLLYVVEDLTQNDPWYGKFDVSHVNKLMEWEIKKAGERQKEFCRNYLEGIVGYSKKIELGDPASVILAFVDKYSIDMVVMCRKGKKGNFPMGGVAQKVVENSSVPVVITPSTGG